VDEMEAACCVAGPMGGVVGGVRGGRRQCGRAALENGAMCRFGGRRSLITRACFPAHGGRTRARSLRTHCVVGESVVGESVVGESVVGESVVGESVVGKSIVAGVSSGAMSSRALPSERCRAARCRPVSFLLASLGAGASEAVPLEAIPWAYDRQNSSLQTPGLVDAKSRRGERGTKLTDGL
jgi:hypothetical protein